ncbi:MAG: hypothetical protein E5V30_15865 [Mesorhizobium sp.]|nr:MAG: hypothetical protein E5V30_15865 [Mesorhizobium sp.]
MGGGERVAPPTLLSSERPMSPSFDASKSLTALDQDSTLVAVIEMSQTKWLIAATVPGFERNPLKKLDADPGFGVQAVAPLAQRSHPSRA